MNWTDVAKTVGAVAPEVGTLLAGPVLGPVIGRAVSKALGVNDNPDEVYQALQTDPEALIKLKQLETELEVAKLAADTNRLTQVNETMRAELTAESKWRGGWRSAIGWVFAASCLGIMAAIIYALFRPGSDAAELLSNALVVFGIMGAVLGVDITRANKERLAAMGQHPVSFMDAVKTRIAKK